MARPRHFIPLSAGDQGQDLFGKGDHNAARNGEHTVGALRGVVGLEGQAHLQNAVAQQDQAHSADQGKDEVGQVVDHAQRIAAGRGCGGGGSEGRHDGDGHDEGQADEQGVQPLGMALKLEFILLQSVHVQCPPFRGRHPPAQTGPRRGARFLVSFDGGCKVARLRRRCGE